MISANRATEFTRVIFLGKYPTEAVEQAMARTVWRSTRNIIGHGRFSFIPEIVEQQILQQFG